MRFYKIYAVYIIEDFSESQSFCCERIYKIHMGEQGAYTQKIWQIQALIPVYITSLQAIMLHP